MHGKLLSCRTAASACAAGKQCSTPHLRHLHPGCAADPQACLHRPSLQNILLMKTSVWPASGFYMRVIRLQQGNADWLTGPSRPSQLAHRSPLLSSAEYPGPRGSLILQFLLACGSAVCPCEWILALYAKPAQEDLKSQAQGTASDAYFQISSAATATVLKIRPGRGNTEDTCHNISKDFCVTHSSFPRSSIWQLLLVWLNESSSCRASACDCTVGCPGLEPIALPQHLEVPSIC